MKDFQFGVSPVRYSVSEYLTKVRQRKKSVKKRDKRGGKWGNNYDTGCLIMDQRPVTDLFLVPVTGV